MSLSNSPLPKLEMNNAGDSSSDATPREIETGKLRSPPAEAEAFASQKSEWTFESSLQVLGGFMCLFNSWGYLNAFGVFQNYYKTTLIPDSSNSTISWIGSIQACLLLLGSAIVGRLFDAGHLRNVLMVGGLLLVFTTCMTSLSTEWYQLFLAQGIGAGLAVGIIFIPGVACVSTWFKQWRAAALGIVASGSSVGAVILPIAAEKLIPKIGFPWALRVIALIQLVTISISIIVMRSRLPPRKAGPWVDPIAFKQISYSTFTIGTYLAFWGLYTPFFYAQSYAEKVNAPSNISPYVLSMMNGASVFGRILPNFLADSTGPLNILIPTVVASGILLFSWLGASTWQGFVAFAVIYGFFSGTLVSLPPACVASLTDPSEMSKIGTRMGMVFSIVGIATLTGTPIAGALISRDNGGYTYAIVFSAASMFCGVIFLVCSRIAKVGPKILIKS